MPEFSTIQKIDETNNTIDFNTGWFTASDGTSSGTKGWLQEREYRNEMTPANSWLRAPSYSWNGIDENGNPSVNYAQDNGSGFADWLKWTPANPITYNSGIRIYQNMNSETRVRIDGVEVARFTTDDPGYGIQWLTIAKGAGSFSNIEIQRGGNNFGWYFIEIDGYLYVDSDINSNLEPLFPSFGYQTG